VAAANEREGTGIPIDVRSDVQWARREIEIVRSSLRHRLEAVSGAASTLTTLKHAPRCLRRCCTAARDVGEADA